MGDSIEGPGKAMPSEIWSDSWGLRYLAVYAIGTVVGIINELLQKPEQPCYSHDPPYTSVLTCGLTNVYGWSLVALTAFFDGMAAARAPTALTVVLIGPVLTACEAVCGLVSGAFFGEQRWCYPPCYLPACRGYISLVSSIYFAVGGALFFWLYYKTPLHGSAKQ